MHEEDHIRQARRSVKAKKGFIMHFAVFIAVMLFLFFINTTITPGFNWAMIVMLGWGIGIVSHYVSVFGVFGLGGRDWEKREIEKELDKLDLDNRTIEKEELLDLNEPMKRRQAWDEDELV